MINFTLQWNLVNEGNEDKLEDLLSDDVIEMVKFKMQHLPGIMWKILISAAFTCSTFDSETMHYLISSTGYTYINDKRLLQILEDAVRMGLLLDVTRSDQKKREYKFLHDRIQEAATSFLLKEESDKLKIQIGKPLERYGLDMEEEWMLFTAVNNLNSVHFLVDDKLDLAHLNSITAKISIEKTSFDSAVVLLSAGIGCLDKNGRWQETCDLILVLFNLLLQTEFSTENHQRYQLAVNEVLLNLASILGKMQTGETLINNFDVDEAQQVKSVLIFYFLFSNPSLSHRVFTFFSFC